MVQISRAESNIEVKIDDIDISGLISSIAIYQDIFSNTITGTALIVDSKGVLFQKPIIGEEKVTVKLSHTTGTISKTFVLYSIENVYSEKPLVYQYLINFCSKELLINSLVKVSKFYKKKASEIVKDLLTNNPPYGLGASGQHNIEESMYEERVIIPYWAPFEAINWLASRAVTSVNDEAANFLFFENLTGYNFVSLETLLSKSPKINITTFDESIDSTKNYRANNARKYNINKHNNIFNNIMGGMYGGRLITHDIMTKEIKVYEYSYRQDFENVQALENVPMISNKSSLDKFPYQVLKTFPLHSEMYTGMVGTRFQPEKFALQRQAQISSIQSFTMGLETGGNINLQAGDVINLDLQVNNGNGGTMESKVYSGDYLVTAIKHSWVHNEITSIIEIGRDSLPISP